MSALSLLAIVVTTATAATAATDAPPMPAMDKKTHHLVVESVIPHAAEAVWAAMAVDYGRVAESHPRIVRSDYRHGSLQGELGAERSCWFNDKGTQVLHEQIVVWNPDEMMLQNRVLEAAGFPVDPENTLATYRVTPIDDTHSRVTFDMEFRTTPAFMGGMMKSSFETLLSDYFVALDHHLRTGESVTRDNFKAVAKLYR